MQSATEMRRKSAKARRRMVCRKVVWLAVLLFASVLSLLAYVSDDWITGAGLASVGLIRACSEDGACGSVALADQGHVAWQAAVVLLGVVFGCLVAATVGCFVSLFYDRDWFLHLCKVANGVASFLVFVAMAVWPVGLDNPERLPCAHPDLKTEVYHMCDPWGIGVGLILQMFAMTFTTFAICLATIVGTHKKQTALRRKRDELAAAIENAWTSHSQQEDAWSTRQDVAWYDQLDPPPRRQPPVQQDVSDNNDSDEYLEVEEEAEPVEIPCTYLGNCRCPRCRDEDDDDDGGYSYLAMTAPAAETAAGGGRRSSSSNSSKGAGNLSTAAYSTAAPTEEEHTEPRAGGLLVRLSTRRSTKAATPNPPLAVSGLIQPATGGSEEQELSPAHYHPQHDPRPQLLFRTPSLRTTVSHQEETSVDSAAGSAGGEHVEIEVPCTYLGNCECPRCR